MDLNFLKYQESWICEDLKVLITRKTYKKGHDLLIVDYHPGDEPSMEHLREIYDKLSGSQTDALFLTNYSDKTKKVSLLEIDLGSFLNDNILQIKLGVYEDEEKKKKSDLLQNQSRRLSPVGELVNYCDSCKHKGDVDYCGDCICDFDIPNSKPSMYEVSTSN